MLRSEKLNCDAIVGLRNTTSFLVLHSLVDALRPAFETWRHHWSCKKHFSFQPTVPNIHFCSTHLYQCKAACWGNNRPSMGLNLILAKLRQKTISYRLSSKAFSSEANSSFTKLKISQQNGRPKKSSARSEVEKGMKGLSKTNFDTHVHHGHLHALFRADFVFYNLQMTLH